jgi:hypothetical protein
MRQGKPFALGVGGKQVACYFLLLLFIKARDFILRILGQDKLKGEILGAKA